MPSMNIRQLRDTRQLKAWLHAGKTVELRDRDRVIGRIVPENSSAESHMWPDFRSRAAKTFGERVLPGADLLIKERGRY
jgi:hypothetical protein